MMQIFTNQVVICPIAQAQYFENNTIEEFHWRDNNVKPFEKLSSLDRNEWLEQFFICKIFAWKAASHPQFFNSFPIPTWNDLIYTIRRMISSAKSFFQNRTKHVFHILSPNVHRQSIANGTYWIEMNKRKSSRDMCEFVSNKP